MTIWPRAHTNIGRLMIRHLFSGYWIFEINDHNLFGEAMLIKSLRGVAHLQETIDLEALSAGSYLVTIWMQDGIVYTKTDMC